MEHRHDDPLPARHRDLRRARVRLRDARRADARDGVPDPRPADQARPTSAARASSEEFYAEGGTGRLRRAPERDQGRAPQEDDLLRGRDRGGRARGGDAVEHRLPGVAVLVRQQHQHARGRLAPLRLPLGADPDAERLRAREGHAQGEGPEPLRRRRARGPDRGRLGEAPGPAVRGSDEDEARQPADRGLRPGDRQPQARRVPRGEPGRRAADRAQVDRLGPRPRRRPQGARPDPPQVGARELDAAGQARRLQRPRSEPDRAVHRRGRLGRRLRQAGPRPLDPGGPAAVRARSSTSRRTGSTRCSPTTRSSP